MKTFPYEQKIGRRVQSTGCAISLSSLVLVNCVFRFMFNEYELDQ